jgi:hypothetical protein
MGSVRRYIEEMNKQASAEPARDSIVTDIIKLALYKIALNNQGAAALESAGVTPEDIQSKPLFPSTQPAPVVQATNPILNTIKNMFQGMMPKTPTQ